ncbi:protein kinase domain-containing protein [Lignipirellula cremea]|uniref:Serine/threonine-protein kinase PknB n=1 Tax=Lignipirellula cremea TaxID=2528010 RepID=A0A518DQE5_9BACT|nr:protein kinase [Lignipirellula cremea]QDU94049.1 Serine/threonine-protein kinase PknB [Lignipirellula cremea]
MTEISDREEVADKLVRWEDAWEQGEDLTPAELCSDRPDLIEAVAQAIEKLKKSAWMKLDPASISAQSDGDPPLKGTLAGRYRIESLIGEGGHGRVYRAFDEELHRHVAVKVASTGKPTPDLLEEARRVAKLRHPNIVPVHDVGRHDDRLFVVTDLVEGRTLADVIDGKPLSIREGVPLIAAVADALNYAHNQGVVHRDLKPSNILMDEQGVPHVTDFGIAATLDELAYGQASSAGTLAYSSPEQLANEIQLIDHRTDIYSLGVVLFETLAGTLPYKGRTPLALREQILFRPPTPLRELVPSASAELEAVCQGCLAKHPADRFQSAAEVARVLRAKPRRAARRFPWQWLVGLMLLAAAFAAGTTIALWPTHSDDRFVRGGNMHFDGQTRIVTDVERTLPVTLEAWIKPDPYKDENCQFIIGSDIPGNYGLGLAICGSMLSVEHISGMINSDASVVPGEWSHIAAVFTASETRLYLNGKLVATGSGSTNEDATKFVIGNVGENNLLYYYRGEIRTVRISEGERYAENFEPPKAFEKDADTLLIVEEDQIDGQASKLIAPALPALY